MVLISEIQSLIYRDLAATEFSCFQKRHPGQLTQRNMLMISQTALPPVVDVRPSELKDMGQHFTSISPARICERIPNVFSQGKAIDLRISQHYRP